MFADDVKIQARHGIMMQRLRNAATQRGRNFGMLRSTIKCKKIRTQKEMDETELQLAEQRIENTTQAMYLGATATALGTEGTASSGRAKKTVNMAQPLNQEDIYGRKLTTDMLVRIWEIFLLPNAIYGLHLMPQTSQIERA